MAIYANINIDQGSSFASVVTVEDSQGLVYNLAGYTVRGQIRKSYSSLTAISFTASILQASAGTIQISLTPNQTGAMKPGRYLYDIEIVETATGSVTRVVEGQIEVSPRVTRPA